MSFKKDFLWGAATASYQIEGAAYEDGKGLNIWDVFSHTPDKVFNSHNGDVACDHYHKLTQDLDLLKELGMKSYRFSVSWARIFPNGTGEINEKGVDFYDRLVDGLLERGIVPCMTLYHWDLPYALHLQGGWLNDQSPIWFAEYATFIKKHFGSRVKHFITFNEPEVFTGLGYQDGIHAPGYRLNRGEVLRVCHNVLKAHGHAVKALRNGEECMIGFTNASLPTMPLTKSEANIEKAREDFFATTADSFVYTNGFWLDPIFTGKYADWVYEFKDINAPKITEEDMELIHQKIDFVGLNIYQGKYIDEEGNFPQNKEGVARTTMGWSFLPEALYWSPYFVYQRYQIPIMITENGMACHDWVSLDGKVHDSNRIDCLHRFIKQLQMAADDGVDVLGYYAWSFFDNFEWAEGYDKRFGIVYVDYETGERIPKDSAYWFQHTIETNGEEL